MKKAWEIELEIRQTAKPVVLSQEEQTWDVINGLRQQADQQVQLFWDSRVPGSGAPECLMVAAVQAAGNKGLDVSRAEKLIPEGLEALKNKDFVTLHRITSLIYFELNRAPRDESSTYWSFQEVEDWETYKREVSFPAAIKVNPRTSDFEDRVYAGWLAQICAGAFGTCLEGYTTDNLTDFFGRVTGYVREPNTFNDDITYELAFLEAFARKGYLLTSRDIAEQWVALIPFGWSAEHVALENLKLGIYPPDSGRKSNPFSEWIGAQMRGAVAGMVAPGNPEEAARLAWLDGVVSHTTNGVIGEVFNALLTSLGFVYQDIRKLLFDVIELIPPKSQYYRVVKDAYLACQDRDNWLEAWKVCEKRLEKYNWVHAYPNAAAEVVALYFGEGNFDKTMEIIGGCGQDVDCNAAQLGAVLGVMFGSQLLTSKWVEPIGDRLETYVRGMEELPIRELSARTVNLIQRYS